MNIATPPLTAEFSGFIADIVTFDIPGIDMENILSLDSFQCPEDDQIFTDMLVESYSDQTIISGYKWVDLRDLLWNDPYFNRIMFIE